MTTQKDRLLRSVNGSEVRSEDFARYDLRLRSIDRAAGEPINLCCTKDCEQVAQWSVWLRTPDWGTGNAGATYVSCNRHALILLNLYADSAAREMAKP